MLSPELAQKKTMRCVLLYYASKLQILRLCTFLCTSSTTKLGGSVISKFFCYSAKAYTKNLLFASQIPFFVISPSLYLRDPVLTASGRRWLTVVPSLLLFLQENSAHALLLAYRCSHIPKCTRGSVVAGENVPYLAIFSCQGIFSSSTSSTTLPQVHIRN